MDTVLPLPKAIAASPKGWALSPKGTAASHVSACLSSLETVGQWPLASAQALEIAGKGVWAVNVRVVASGVSEMEEYQMTKGGYAFAAKSGDPDGGLRIDFIPVDQVAKEYVSSLHGSGESSPLSLPAASSTPDPAPTH